MVWNHFYKYFVGNLAAINDCECLVIPLAGSIGAEAALKERGNDLCPVGQLEDMATSAGGLHLLV